MRANRTLEITNIFYSNNEESCENYQHFSTINPNVSKKVVSQIHETKSITKLITFDKFLNWSTWDSISFTITPSWHFEYTDRNVLYKGNGTVTLRAHENRVVNTESKILTELHTLHYLSDCITKYYTWHRCTIWLSDPFTKIKASGEY